MLENVGIVDTDDHVADQENAGPSPAKKKRTKTTEIQLENAPQDEVTVKNPKLSNNLMYFFLHQVHPLLHKTGTKERGASKKPQGRPPNKEKGKSKGK